MNVGQIFDAHKIMNDMAHQALGDKALTVVDSSSFVNVGQSVLATGYENTLKALGAVVGKTIFSARPYTAPLESLRVSEERWGAITRKIVPLWNDADAPSEINTDGVTGYPTEDGVQNMADGNSIDMYTIKNPKAIQINFWGEQALMKYITRYRDKLEAAFHNESEFMQFIAAYMVEFYNEVAVLNETKSRITLLNRVTGQMAMGLATYDMAAMFNANYGTAYTRQQLLSTYLPEFMKFVSAEVKIISEFMRDLRTTGFHANITGYNNIPRHTPKIRQKMVMYNPLFIHAESEVYSTLFHPQYLGIGDFEGINFWQSPSDPARVNVQPSVLNPANGQMEKAATRVEIPYVLGLLYDEDGLGWCPVYDYTAATPLNARGLYWNIFMHWRFKSYNDYTENAALFVIGEGGAVAGLNDAEGEAIMQTRAVKATKNIK